TPLNTVASILTHTFIELLQVAVVTLDISGLARNMTYGQHYKLSVYLDCKPCPTRYQCEWEVDPPTCSTPR
ncbi:unnamed protein product, partial [Scytosiphon promiscuus]